VGFRQARLINASVNRSMAEFFENNEATINIWAEKLGNVFGYEFLLGYDRRWMLWRCSNPSQYNIKASGNRYKNENRSITNHDSNLYLVYTAPISV
jgi:hypothetical protein